MNFEVLLITNGWIVQISYGLTPLHPPYKTDWMFCETLDDLLNYIKEQKNRNGIENI